MHVWGNICQFIMSLFTLVSRKLQNQQYSPGIYLRVSAIHHKIDKDSTFQVMEFGYNSVWELSI